MMGYGLPTVPEGADLGNGRAHRSHRQRSVRVDVVD